MLHLNAALHFVFQFLVYIISIFLGGDLHNQIGIGNDALCDLFKGLDKAGLSNVVCDIKNFLDSSKTIGGAGCTPAAHHGGQYNGKDIIKVFNNHDKIFKIVPDTFEEKNAFKILYHSCDLIFTTLGKARFLTDVEIKNLEINILNLSELICLKFKNRNITLKMHDVLGNYALVMFGMFFFYICIYNQKQFNITTEQNKPISISLT